MEKIQPLKCIKSCKNAIWLNDRFFKCIAFKTDIYYSLNVEAYNCPMFKRDNYG
jgi:hypothetical protein